MGGAVLRWYDITEMIPKSLIISILVGYDTTWKNYQH